MSRVKDRPACSRRPSAPLMRKPLCLDEAGPESDVDLLVGFAPGTKSFDRLLALSHLLEERLGRRVEVVTTEALSPFLGPRILAEAEDVLRAA